MSNKESFVKECYRVKGSSIIRDVSFRRSLCQYEESKYEFLLSFFSNFFLCRNDLTFAFGSQTHWGFSL